MKANVFLVIIALLIGGLITYGFYAAGATTLQTAVSGALCSLFLVAGIALSVEEYPRTSMLVKVTASSFFALLLLLNIALALFDVSEAPYVIANGLLTLIAVTIIYLIIKSKS